MRLGILTILVTMANDLVRLVVEPGVLLCCLPLMIEPIGSEQNLIIALIVVVGSTLIMPLPIVRLRISSSLIHVSTTSFLSS